jgi:LacI family transcriptional regulator
MAQVTKELASQGFIERHARKGTFVAPVDKWRTPEARTEGLLVGALLYASDRLLPAIGAELHRCGYGMLVRHADSDVKETLKTLVAWREMGVSGLLWSPLYTADNIRDNTTLAEAILASGIPAVAVDRYPRAVEVSCVVSDNAEAAHTLTTYLTDLGHRRIGLIRHRHGSTADDRHDGYERALRGAGISPEPGLVLTVDHNENLQDLVTRVGAWLAATRPTAAWSITSEPLGYALLAAAQACGLAVPDDLSVATFDEIVAPWPVTRMIQPTEAIGRRAVQLLREHVKSPSDEIQRVILRSHLVAGDSCRPYQTPLLAEA